jgi:Flp pilus assembly protein TadB
MLLFAVLLLPFWGFSSTLATSSPGQNTASGYQLTQEKPNKHPRLLQRISKKMLLQRMLRSGDSYGKGFTIAGCCIAILTIICWLLAPVVGLLLSVPLGLIGLIFSIIGFVKARRYRNNENIKRLAIAGMIVNAIFFAGGIIFFGFFFRI